MWSQDFLPMHAKKLFKETKLTEGTWLTSAKWMKDNRIKQKNRKKKKVDPGPGGNIKSRLRPKITDSRMACTSSQTARRYLLLQLQGPRPVTSTHTIKRCRREEDSSTRSAKTAKVPPTETATSASGSPVATERLCGTGPLFRQSGYCVVVSRKWDSQRKKWWSSEGGLIMRSSRLRT